MSKYYILNERKSILICPLNWGLGHASRLIPVVNMLISKGNLVIFAAGKETRQFLKREFPNYKHIKFENYKVKYSQSKSQLFAMLKLAPKIILSTIDEHYKLKKIINDLNIDIVISDNRFGLWNKKVYSVFITHQLKVIFPKRLRCFEPVYQYLLRRIIARYDECWVPDNEGRENLAGMLSHSNNKQKNISYIGPISRFKYSVDTFKESEYIDVLFILSGPEPQRSLFEEIIYERTKGSDLEIAIVRGTSMRRKIVFDHTTYDLLNSNELEHLLRVSKKVVCRSGYSSIMDLVALNKKAILVPTPGQTEQEYLAEYLSQKEMFYSLMQNEFSLEALLGFNCNELRDFENTSRESLEICIDSLQKK